MPIYEYRCSNCGETMELLVRTDADKNYPRCENCDSPGLERLISAPSIPKQLAAASPRCGKGTTCCGSSTPCENPSCS